MTRICFVTYEIHPTTTGGAGVLLHNAAHVLLQQGHTVIFLLYVPEHEFNRFNQIDRLALPHPENCRAYNVTAMCADLALTQADFGYNEFLWRAYCFHHAAQKVAAQERPEIIEFFDYCGVAHYALAAKLSQNAYPHSQLTIRLHTPLELMDRQEPTKSHTFDRYLAFALEHHALRLTETVLYPSPAYLKQAYRPFYEPWLGRQVYSKPPLINHPHPQSPITPRNPLVLFYGRLYNMKGADLFVEAAAALLETQMDTPLRFALVGYDSRQSPDGSPTYQAYLEKKIPARFLSHFQFMGQLTWTQMEQLLPRVQFAVFPTYFDSFSYAAHELYAAGIPLIVNQIPAFEDYFKHEINALVFNGTVSDLTGQMSRLAADADLRQRLSRPYSLADAPLGDFYAGPVTPSWIKPAATAAPNPSLLVCLLANGPESHLTATLDSLAAQLPAQTQIVLCHPTVREEGGAVKGQAIWWLGRLYILTTSTGEPLPPTGVKTAETLLILAAGDSLRPGYLSICLETLARQPELSFVGCWKQVSQGASPRLDTFPVDAVAELLPLRGQRRFNRAVMRTQPGQLLLDLFDPRLAECGEIGYLWQLEDEIGPGIVIPEVMLELPDEPAYAPNPNLISYLLLRNTSATRQRRWSRYLVGYLLESGVEQLSTLDDRQQTMQAHLEWHQAELARIKATTGWQLLEKYWRLKARVKALLRRGRD